MGNQKITCRENSKYDTNNRSLQEKPLRHERHATQKFSSHDQVVCLLRSAISTENREPRRHSCSTLPSFWLHLHSGGFYSWSSCGNLNTNSAFNAHLATAPTLWSPPGVVGQREARREVSFPWDSLHVTALLWMTTHKTACQPGNGLAFTNLKL